MVQASITYIPMYVGAEIHSPLQYTFDATVFNNYIITNPIHIYVDNPSTVTLFVSTFKTNSFSVFSTLWPNSVLKLTILRAVILAMFILLQV